MKLQYLIFFFLGTFLMSAQENLTFSVEWNQRYEPTINNNIWTGNDVFLQNDFIPLYIKQWKKDKPGELNNINFTNIVTKRVVANALGGIDINSLPISFNPSLKIVKERANEYYSIQANAIYKNTKGEVFQIQSFQVSYDLNTTSKQTSNYRISQENAVSNSVLSTGTWYKIAIDKTGVFKIDAAFLKSIGIETSSLDPKKIRVFGNGGAILPEILSKPRKEGLTENAIYVAGENDGVFNDNDYVLFYAQGPISWDLESRTDITHKQNIYSEYAYYFINVDSGTDGKRIANAATVNNPKTIDVTTFTDYKLHEKELFNYIRVGKKWFGENFTVNNQQDFTFNFPNIVNSQSVIVNGNFSAKSASTSSIYTVSYNSINVLNSTISSSGNFAFRDTKSSGSFMPISDDITLNVQWNSNGDFSALAYLDYLEVIADRTLTATGKQFGFVNFDSKTSGEVLEYHLTNDTEIDFVWNVSDLTNVKRIVDTDVNTTNFKFKELTDGVLDKYQIVKTSDAYAPIKLSSSSNVVNQNLHALQDIHYVIVTKKDFINEANRLRDYHRNNTPISETNSEKIKVEVVDVDQIYNEFGSGAPDITAIRDFAKYLYDNSSSEEMKLKYLCLFGDASFDYKGITYKETQVVPTYLSTVSNSLSNSYSSDDYYGFLDASDNTQDNGELQVTGKLDITTGRIPVGSITKANQYVSKLLNYYSTKSRGNWKTKITLLGDDGQEGSDQSLIKYLEDSALKIEANNPNLNLSKLYTDAFKEEITSGGGRYPEITKKFRESFNTGSLVINYFGHGNNFNLGQETYLDIAAIRSFRNLNNLPLFITVTCDFSRFDDPTILSGGEELIEGAYGGAVAMITTTREISIFAGNSINKNLADYLYSFDGKTRTAAEALKDVKNNVGLSNEFFVYFFGDPAMNLSLPKEGIEISKIEKYVTDPVSEEVSLQNVTELNALSKVKVTGSIKEAGNVLSDFTGTLSVTLFDKEIDRKTLLNEGSGTVVNFKSLESKVFVGEASVKNGKFSFDFILSKDVSVSPENAKFSFYAASDTKERIGSDFNFKVGGIDPQAPEDNIPPVIQLYMDDETFVDGGNTSTTPKLLAKIQDESGINTSLNSIGHNITVVIDGDLANPISLNEFYTTEKDDFTKGIVSYKLPELSTGNHTITFKAWDTYNNSSTQTLSFYAQEDKGFQLSRVLNYPNPFINHTEFWFKNNRQGDPIEITVQIYTLSGKLIKTIHTSDSNVDEISRVVTWDGKDDFGNKLGKGVYVYKLTVKEIITGQSDEKIEKLVIL
ncbi:type IX secretion system sortase PorU [Wenyingzhuangia sp. chi5]|uniref:Type IX secretion system sortase PorU n=1 Tax=Wenyingzhuangia gilva TaxID=3057677 RepID=A0ABT8VU31_9FLAO|nr:type IX secretion system sortase PorU [Wenyingzhuangia sp. chi5]MDO3695468.1 type IX secretion system sortase PorU [Wenyingzhuangia sp. chi5]